MRPYEIVIIFDAGLDESTVRQVVDRAVETLRSGGGNPGRVDHWGRRRFAYQVAGKWEGNYVIIETTSPSPSVAETSRMLSLADEVIRHKVVSVPDGAAGRHRPTPPEDQPASAGNSRPAADSAAAAPRRQDAASVATSD